MCVNEHLKEFLRLLNANDVEYVVIGAHALAFHGLPRYTEDLDLWLARTTENARKLAAALNDFGMPFPPGGEEAFAEGQRMVRLGNPPNRIDILNFGAKLPFGEVWDRRLSAQIDEVPVPMISRADFIRSKRDAGRPKDLRDLEELGEA
jgi:hypothetical protein